ncbi:MAG: hypothetical protein R6X34_24650 [Chloroflexota bacterium]
MMIFSPFYMLGSLPEPIEGGIGFDKLSLQSRQVKSAPAQLPYPIYDGLFAAV